MTSSTRRRPCATRGSARTRGRFESRAADAQQRVYKAAGPVAGALGGRAFSLKDAASEEGGISSLVAARKRTSCAGGADHLFPSPIE